MMERYPRASHKDLFPSELRNTQLSAPEAQSFWMGDWIYEKQYERLKDAVNDAVQSVVVNCSPRGQRVL